LALGASYPKTIRIPGDLIQGAVSITPHLPDPAWQGRSGADFILGDLRELALVSGFFDGTVALGLIDMLEDPEVLVRLQHQILPPNGWAVQASPYIWHEPVARSLREGAKHQGLDLGSLSSAQAIQALYREGGFDLDESLEALTWVFFKHRRQIELYSVHWSVHWSGHKCEL
jgi:SAM-dependent methyltransferase